MEPLGEIGRWRSRKVSYWAGCWEHLSGLIPTFEAEEFRISQDTPANPHLKMVVRAPQTLFGQPIPVGVVSNTYRLAQHASVADKCLQGIGQVGIDPEPLRCELGLSELGEWMNFRILFPGSFNFQPEDGEPVGLRLECFNSVDGSSSLVILLGWIRFICSNGMVFGKTLMRLRDVHNRHLDLDRIPDLISKNLAGVQEDVGHLRRWEGVAVKPSHLTPWTDKDVTEKWGKKAACRAFHICSSGYDVEIIDPFAPGKATEKPVEKTVRVPGAPRVARNAYDASQALSWIASRRGNVDMRVEWQADIPKLVERLTNLVEAN